MTPVEKTEEQYAEEAQAMREGMGGQVFYIMHRRSLTTYTQKQLVKHYHWLKAVEKKGQMLLSGARFDKDGQQQPGMSVLCTESWEAAEEIATSDPFVTEGVVSFFIEYWRIGGGRLTLSMNFSDRTSRLIY